MHVEFLCWRLIAQQGLAFSTTSVRLKSYNLSPLTPSAIFPSLMFWRFANALLVAWFAVVALGVPLPAGNVSGGSAEKQAAGERFPCENCPCGCNTAEKCWNNCCCHSPAERLAWAKREGVTPPAYVVAAAAKQAPVRTCCSKCGSCSTAETPPNSSPEKTLKQPNGKPSIIVLKAMQCQGLSFASHGIALAPPPERVSVAWNIPVEPSTVVLPALASDPVFSPPTPPPQVS
ncbi:hypothetical protein HG15A2_00250 [Adhaeretor mobilis]|uniref:Uncharacterized protein n=1 Tax=Adhaeretor mobilis TaxID=1930276 RepID=A0A517MPQ1_9BACT|nr:hypothetical protein HG15A2_00250 [Adhaeretor mobilis]